MKPFPVSIYPDLQRLGDLRALDGTLEEKSFPCGGQHLSTPNGIDYDIQFTNTGEAILLTGTVRATVETSCDRCLEPVSIDIDGEVQGYYLLEPAESVEGYEDDEFEVIADDGSFDISDPILAALVYSMPFMRLCSDECKGLCPHCGANLNEGPCDCDDDGIDPLNPFSVLKGLDLD